MSLFEQYFRDVGKHKLLTAEEERSLLKSYHFCKDCGHQFEPPADRVPLRECPCGAPRDFAARDKLVQANLKFVIKTARGYLQNKADEEALMNFISAGQIGLLIAIDKFDLSRNLRFLTYAGWWIHEEIHVLMNRDQLVHIPTHRQKLRRKKIKEGADLAPDATVVPFEDVLAHKEEATLDTKQGFKFLRKALKELPISERNQTIVRLSFGLGPGTQVSQPKTLRQIASICGTSSERIRQILVEVKGQLYEHLKELNVEKLSDIAC